MLLTLQYLAKVITKRTFSKLRHEEQREKWITKI